MEIVLPLIFGDSHPLLGLMRMAPFRPTLPQS
jgi:hypothetical protein